MQHMNIRLHKHMFISNLKIINMVYKVYTQSF